jgi:predicted Zn-dependent protease
MNLHEHFNAIARRVESLTHGDEISLTNYYAERSDFLSFNRSAVRQPGSISDVELTVDLIKGQKRASTSMRLTGVAAEDESRIAVVVAEARDALGSAPDDPFLLFNKSPKSSEHVAERTLPTRAEAIDAITAAGQGRDMVGIYAAGRTAYGFANSLGQRNWHSADSFNLDWCFYHSADKAVKANYAGFEWRQSDFDRIVDGAVETLPILSRAPKTVAPGTYRAYMTPAAMAEIWGWLLWGSFGLQTHKTRSTPFLRSIDGVDEMAKQVSLIENIAEGVAPAFQSDGFLRPARTTLINHGDYDQCLISPRSAMEHGVETNGANEAEQPQSLDMSAGDIPRADAVRRLGTGVYVSNLWYLNYSDRNNGRLTGLTRFATMWVENGEIVTPLNVMRFDDTIYRMLGSALEGLTAERDMILDTGTYGRRSVDSMRLPGALIGEFRLTL